MARQLDHFAFALFVLGLLCLTQFTTGCGFHLRNWDLTDGIESAYVRDDGNVRLSRDLQRALRQAGVVEANVATEADIVINLLAERNGRRAVTTNDSARVAEYEITQGIRYSVIDQDDVELVPAQWLLRSRVFRVNRDNIVGNAQEQSLLEEEMRKELTNQILRALSAVTQVPEREVPEKDAS